MRIADVNECIGCGVCALVCKQNAIEMVISNGFSVPIVDHNKCIGCSNCSRYCPILNIPEKNDGMRWYGGFEEKSYQNEKSSSGGIGDAIALFYIQTGGIVYGAAFDDDYNLIHKRIESISEIVKIRGSKYLQSEIDLCLPQIVEDLLNNKNVCFIGTPCQISAVKLFVPTRLHDRLLLIDFICHGVPSPVIGHDYLQWLQEKRNGQMADYIFRSKVKGWSPKYGKIYVEENYKNGRKRVYHADYSPLHGWFGRHLSLRDSCFNCKYRSRNRCSDITIADFWECDKIFGSIPYKQGVSAIQVTTEKGKTIIDKLKTLGYIQLIEVSENDIWHNRNEGDKNKMNIPSERQAFLNCYNDYGIEGLIRSYPGSTKTKRFIRRIKALFHRFIKR